MWLENTFFPQVLEGKKIKKSSPTAPFLNNIFSLWKIHRDTNIDVVYIQYMLFIEYKGENEFA